MDSRPEIVQHLLRIEARLNDFEALLIEIACKVNRSKTDPAYVSLSDAALMVGKSKSALQKMIQRETYKADGLKIRRMKGSVHRKDFLHFLEYKASKHPGRGERIRAVLKEMER